MQVHRSTESLHHDPVTLCISAQCRRKEDAARHDDPDPGPRNCNPPPALTLSAVLPRLPPAIVLSANPSLVGGLKHPASWPVLSPLLDPVPACASHPFLPALFVHLSSLRPPEQLTPTQHLIDTTSPCTRCTRVTTTMVLATC